MTGGISVFFALSVSELGRVCALELELQLVCDEGDELRIGGLALGVGHGVPEKALQGVQIPPIPGHLDGVADGPLHPGGGGLECFCHLGVQYLRDGVGVLAARQRVFRMGVCGRDSVND